MSTEKDRINTCINKYGLDEKEAIRIVKEDNCVLSIEELRMKYDYQDLGIKYPDWLTPLEHRKMCSATVKQMFNENFARFTTPEDMAGDLYVQTALRLNDVKNHKVLKDYIVKQAMNMYRNNTRRLKYWAGKSIDTNLNEQYDMCDLDFMEAIDYEAEEVDCLNAVKSIKSREVRELLILCGYLIGNIGTFKAEYDYIVNNSDLVDKEKLVQIVEQIKRNDEIDRNKIDKIETEYRKKSITFIDVFKAMKLDLDVKSAREEIGYYLATTNFLTK